MQLKKLSIQDYADKIKNKEYFSLSRYGDGEWLCILGAKGGNSNGCAYTPELRNDLVNSLMINDPNYLLGMQRILPQQLLQADNYLRDHGMRLDWVDSEIFADSLANGDLFPLIEQLRDIRTIVIGNEEWKWNNNLFKPDKWIKVPRANAHLHRDRVIEEVLATADSEPTAYLFSCGMAACDFVARLHGKIPDSFMIDIGHIWDPFCGLKSRDYLIDLDEDIIKQNLYAKA